MSDIVEKSVRCTCIGGEHYLHFTVFKDEPQIYIDLNAKTPHSFWSRLKEAWNILRGKEACYDGIILDQAKSKEVAEFINQVWPLTTPIP